MPEPTTAALISSVKAWSILAALCGSVIPILALSEKKKTSIRNASFMALTGGSFSIFVGPWLALYLNFQSIEAIVALSWGLGVVGVYAIRAILNWLERRGEQTIDNVVRKVTGTADQRYFDESDREEKGND